jgi:GDP-mannose pyrophosphatase NudK
MAKNVQVTSTEILSDNFFPLKNVKYKIEGKDGSVKELTREVYCSSNGVTALLYNRINKRVILTRQFRLPTFLNGNTSGMLIETCAGLVEENEDPAAAITREIEEETGYKIEGAKKVFELYSTAGSVAEKLYYFVAEYSKDEHVSEGGGLEEENEEIEVIELPFDQAYQKVETGEIADAKTVILLQYAKINIFQDEEGEKVFDIL